MTAKVTEVVADVALSVCGHLQYLLLSVVTNMLLSQ